MPALSMKMNALLFLYSTRNLVGSVMGLAGLGLFFTGVIEAWWFPIVIGLYAAGWLATPGDRELALRVYTEATQANLTDSVEALIAASRKQLPDEAVKRLLAIQFTVQGLAPKLFSGTVGMEHRISLVNAVTRDLPETISNYLRLPTAFATLHAVADGKTCKQLLVEQLVLLDEQLARMAQNIYQDDAEALIVNGRFLQDKFRPVSFIG